MSTSRSTPKAGIGVRCYDACAGESGWRGGGQSHDRAHARMSPKLDPKPFPDPVLYSVGVTQHNMYMACVGATHASCPHKQSKLETS